MRGSFTSVCRPKNFLSHDADVPTVLATTSKARSHEPTRLSSLSISSPRALLVASVSVAAFMFRDFLSCSIITSLPRLCFIRCMEEESDRDTFQPIGLHAGRL